MISAVQKKQESKNEDKKMINSLMMKNFRCFESAELDDLKTVNVIVGGNGSGKTALLEGLYLTLGNPTLSFKLKSWRGLGMQAQFSDDAESRNGLWRDLFYKFEQNHSVCIETKGTPNVSRSLRITCNNRESLFIPNKKGSATQTAPITFRYYRGTQEIQTIKPVFSADGMTLDGHIEPVRGSFFASTLAPDPQERARHFSSISKKQDEQEIVEAIHRLYPMVQDLSLELSNDVPMIFASLEGVPEKVPLGLVSTGISKMVGYLSAIAVHRDGIVIIDEIENGIYYDKIKDVWEILFWFCQKHGVQLFASTHSLECLQAAASASDGKEESFSLIKVVRGEDRSNLYQSSGLNFRRAIDQHMEIR